MVYPLRVTINYDMKFEKHFSKLCKKANRRINALSRQVKQLCFNKQI